MTGSSGKGLEAMVMEMVTGRRRGQVETKERARQMGGEARQTQTDRWTEKGGKLKGREEDRESAGENLPAPCPFCGLPPSSVCVGMYVHIWYCAHVWRVMYVGCACGWCVFMCIHVGRQRAQHLPCSRVCLNGFGILLRE